MTSDQAKMRALYIGVPTLLLTVATTPHQLWWIGVIEVLVIVCCAFVLLPNHKS